MNQLGRRAVIALSGCLGLVVLGVIGGVTYLRSESGSRYILSKAKAAALEQGMQLEYASGRIDPFASVDFENLKVTQDKEGTHLQALVRRIHIEYAISFLGRRVDVRKIEILDPHVELKARMPAHPDSKAQPAPGASQGGKGQLPVLPFEISVQELVLSGLQVALDQQSEASNLSMQVQGMDAKFDADFARGQLRLGGAFKLDARDIRWSAPGGAPGPKTMSVALASVRSDSIIKVEQARSLAEVDAQLALGRLDAVLPASKAGAKAEHATIASQQLKVRGGQAPDGWSATMDFAARAVAMPSQLKRPSELAASMRIKTPTDLRSLDLRGELSLETIRMADWELKAAIPGQGPGPVEAQLQAGFVPDRKLKAVLVQGASLEMFEGERIPLKATVKLPGSFATLMDAAGAKQGEGHFEIMAPQLTLPTLSRGALPFGASGDLRWNAGQYDAKVSVDLAATQLTALTAHATVADGKTLAQLSFESVAGEELDKLLKDSPLRKHGKWKIQGGVDFNQSAAGLSEKGTLTLTQERVASWPVPQAQMSEPILIKHRLEIVAGKKTDGELTADIPALEIAGVGRISDTHFAATVHTPEASQGKDLDLTAELKQAEIALREPRALAGQEPKALASQEPKALASQELKIPGLAMNARAHVRDLGGIGALELEAFELDVGRGLFKLTADATGKLKGGDIEARGVASIHVPEDFPAVAGMVARGRMRAPWTVSIVDGKELDFESTLNLIDFAVAAGQNGATGISGRIPISEKLVWDGKRLHFGRIITQNPFERVDFERVRPLIDGADQVRVQGVSWEDKSYGPISAYFSVRQNMIQAQQVDMNLGAGRFYGEMFLDAYPSRLQFGLLSRVTGLNLAEVLPRKYLAKMQGAEGGKSVVSGRTGIVVDLNKQTVDGRIDITQIGGPQLIMLINVLDPAYQDEKMNKLRYALSIGYPTFVAMAMQEGYLDMRISLELLGLQQDQRLHGISITPWISAAVADVTKPKEKTQ